MGEWPGLKLATSREQVVQGFGVWIEVSPSLGVARNRTSRNEEICKCLSFHEQFFKQITIQNHKTPCCTPDRFILYKLFLPFLLCWPILQCTFFSHLNTFETRACLTATASQMAGVFVCHHLHTQTWLWLRTVWPHNTPLDVLDYKTVGSWTGVWNVPFFFFWHILIKSRQCQHQNL